MKVYFMLLMFGISLQAQTVDKSGKIVIDAGLVESLIKDNMQITDKSNGHSLMDLRNAHYLAIIFYPHADELLRAKEADDVSKALTTWQTALELEAPKNSVFIATDASTGLEKTLFALSGGTNLMPSLDKKSLAANYFLAVFSKLVQQLDSNDPKIKNTALLLLQSLHPNSPPKSIDWYQNDFLSSEGGLVGNWNTFATRDDE